jgi:hypothetical protein
LVNHFHTATADQLLILTFIQPPEKGRWEDTLPQIMILKIAEKRDLLMG